jgi:predicted Zn-dependent protease
VLAAGAAASVEDLWATVDHGLYVPALSLQREADGDAFRHTGHGALLISNGELGPPAADMSLLVDPLAVLASVEALGAAVRELPLSGDGVAEVPALRAAAGCRVG